MFKKMTKNRGQNIRDGDFRKENGHISQMHVNFRYEKF
jgi:hypothetical protein